MCVFLNNLSCFSQNYGMYYNYHARVKKLIAEGKLIGYEIVEEYHGISPALVLHFSDHPPMPIRDYCWEEYFKILEK